MHGDRLGAAASGKAMELMCQPLIWLADRLRSSYGEGGLLPLYRMVCRFSAVLEGGLILGGLAVKDLDSCGLSLHWPPWFAAGNAELLSLAQGLVTAWRGGILSRETATRIYANATGNPDPAAEWARLVDQMMPGETEIKRQES